MQRLIEGCRKTKMMSLFPCSHTNVFCSINQTILFQHLLQPYFLYPLLFHVSLKMPPASWLSLFSSALFGAHNFFLFFSQMVQCALLSPLSEAVNASPLILHSDLSLLHLILKSHSTETKQKAEKKASTSKALIRAPYILQQSLALVASKDSKQIPFR